MGGEMQVATGPDSHGFPIATQDYIRQFGFPSEIISAKKVTPKG